jgi:PBSX family phage terminase large subunit
VILTPAQNVIAADTHRFRVLNCGRRFGKTSLAIEEIKGKAIGKPSRIAYTAPTYQQARDIAWEPLKKELRPVITSVNEARLEIKTRSMGGESFIILRGWEAIDTLRGQSLDFIVPDEVALCRNFHMSWQEIIRPTLTDRRGEALFMSTPKGFNHFYDLYNLQETEQDFKSFHFTTYDNPFIPVDEIEAAKRQLTEDAFAQEYLADFRKQQGLVYKEFDRSKHVYTEIPEGTGFTANIAGVDFGFVHPAAVLTLKIDRSDNVWVSDEYYETGRTDIEIAEYVAALHSDRVYPDPESPSAIEELKRHGVNTRPVVKGKDSEKHGIDKVRELLKANKLHVHVSCKNLINEFETHAYKDGKDEPEETGEDALDALRYPIMMMMPETHEHEPLFEDDSPIYSQIGV